MFEREFLTCTSKRAQIWDALYTLNTINLTHGVSVERVSVRVNLDLDNFIAIDIV